MENNKKQTVKILTFHWSDNYGALLQSYALMITIKKMGYDCSIFDYVNNYNKEIEVKLFHCSKRVIQDLFFFKNHILRRIASDNFRRLFVLSKNVSSSDILVIGSDQVWNPHITNYDDTYFGACLKPKRIISYAASMGQNLQEKDKDWFFDNLDNINEISVREETLKNFINSQTQKNVQVVLDPSMLLTKQEWESIPEDTSIKINQPYIFVYSVDGGNKEFINIVNQISNFYNIGIVCAQQSIHRDYKFKHVIKTFGNYGPEMFLTLLKNAQYVITSSFHGTVFSILFNKKFIACQPSQNASRVKDILTLFGLEKHLVTSYFIGMENLLSETINYVPVVAKLEEYRSISFKWLNNSLGKA